MLSTESVIRISRSLRNKQIESLELVMYANNLDSEKLALLTDCLKTLKDLKSLVLNIAR